MEKGIKETKEALQGSLVIVKEIAHLLKDGAQIQDLVDGFVAINSDPVKKKAIEDALAGIQEVPAEVKDVDLAEASELAILLIREVPELVKAFKKES